MTHTLTRNGLLLASALLWLPAACGADDVVVVDRAAETESAVNYNECWTALFSAIDGGHPSYPGGGGPDDPTQIFIGGGSENTPVVCRTAKYYIDHDPGWFMAYFDVQAASGAPYWSHGELFSSVYTSLVVGCNITVLNHARERGHTALVDKASDWLRRYWAYMAMAALDKKVSLQRGYNIHGNPLEATVSTPGFNTGIVGTRTYVNGYGGASMVTGNGSQHCLFNMALEHPNRNCPGDMRPPSNYYGGMGAAALVLGYRFDSGGHFNPRGRSIDPEHFGLTTAERAALGRYIRTDGQQSTNEVWGMVAQSQLYCPISIIRTTQGVISWWGTSQGVTQTCNSRKGGNWGIAKFEKNGTTTFVNRSPLKYGNSRYPVWRDGNEICAESDAMPEVCVSIPGGTVVHELQLGRHKGVRLVEGTPPPPPPPPPPAGTDGASFVGQVVPTSVGPGDSFSVQITMRNTGSSTWTAAGKTRLGSQNPQDNRTWGVGRISLPSNASVTPSSSHTFVETVTAPSAPGTYNFQWKMLREGVAWFGARTPNLVITVTGGGGETCGNGTCGAGESCSSCPADCGSCASGQGNELLKGELLRPGEALQSSDGRFRLVYQTDGNLVLSWGASVLWQSTTAAATAGMAKLQSDGNFVIRDASNQAVWATATNPDGHRMRLQNDGNLVVRDAAGVALWASGSGGH